MNVDKAIKARELMNLLDHLNGIKQVIEEERSHWWSSLTPDIKRRDSDGMIMPTILREEFKEALNRALEKTNKKLVEL